MQDRTKNDRHDAEISADGSPPASDDGRLSRSGRIQIKDGRHNVWDTSSLSDTQSLLSFLENPELTLAEDTPQAPEDSGNPYNTMGCRALRFPKPRGKD
ncbi:hypothetical protein BH24PSE2_BH24PSE2_07770 [soil metagenome]